MISYSPVEVAAASLVMQDVKSETERAESVVKRLMTLQSLRSLSDNGCDIRKQEFDILDEAERAGVDLSLAGVSPDWRSHF